MSLKLATPKGFVWRSASWARDEMGSNLTSWTLSQIMWQSILIYLVCSWNVGFAATCKADIGYVNLERYTWSIVTHRW